MRTLAVERPGFRRARTPVPRSQNPASRPRTGPGSPSRSPRLHPPTGDHAERVAPLRRDHRDPRATAQPQRPHRDYSVSSAGRRPGSPSRGNWSSWKVTISVIAPPVTRSTSIVSGR
jgi:hypothetical protein